MATSIEWTDETWNPLRGCRRVSPGCERCYAERQAARPILSGPGLPYEGLVRLGKGGPRWTGETAGPDQLDAPLRWKKPRRVFPCSMSDLFYEGHSDEQIAAVFGVMAATPEHTYQVLTKRIERARRWLEWIDRAGFAHDGCLNSAAAVPGMRQRIEAMPSTREQARLPWPLPNVWIGASVEDQQRADERLPHLLATPAAVRFVSYEPALGPVDWRDVFTPTREERCERSIDWLIVGGESGPGARPFDLFWARHAVAQCKAAGVPVFVKQLGALPHLGDCRTPEGDRLDHEGRLRGDFLNREASARIVVRDRKGGDMDEWPEDLRVREMPRGR